MGYPVYSKLFISAIMTADTPVTYTVPDGYTAVIVDISMFAESDTAGVMFVADASDVLITGAEIPGDGSFTIVHWVGRQVVEEGNEFLCLSTITGASLRVTGYLLSN